MKPSEILRMTALECASVDYFITTQHELHMAVAKVAEANGYALRDAKTAEYFWAATHDAIYSASRSIPVALEAAAAKLESEGK